MPSSLLLVSKIKFLAPHAIKISQTFSNAAAFTALSPFAPAGIGPISANTDTFFPSFDASAAAD